MTGSEIIEQVLTYVGVKAPTFAKSIGVKYQRILDIQSGKVKKVSGTLANHIIDKYPEFRIEYLLQGEGEMLADKQPNNVPQVVEKPKHIIRYWVDVEATGGNLISFDDLKECKHIDIAIPEFEDCTDAINLYGKSMEPMFKSGQIIILKKWVESFIDFGNPYLIVTKAGNRMLKIIRSVRDDDSEVSCVSCNPEFDPFILHKAEILSLWLVKGAIEKTTL
ncbi:MAG: hypothetical protein LKK08_06085 [Bacteroidales bacterium]|jgi:phage repressor protein C with HTH and peptisase S24 domain|nr:hypothetical protein [Bacteroidales bacterium]